MSEPDSHLSLSEWIKSRALELGFSACGISKAGYLEEEKDRLLDWLMKGCYGEMAYMARNVEKRLNPGLLFEGARSVISVLMNYFPEEVISGNNNYKISRYAFGRDYHDVMKEKLEVLIKDLKSSQFAVRSSQDSGTVGGRRSAVGGQEPETRNQEPITFRAFVDSAPVLDKAWAEKAGLGWIGKHTLLIHPKMGSFVFVGEIVTNLELEYDTDRVNDLCGGCTKCLDACPTGAITGPRVVDARKCISYLTIEYNGELPESERANFHDCIFGCDICQEVCPWNQFAKPTLVEDFRPSEELKLMNKEKWNSLTREDFQRLFRGSAVRRTKFEGLKRNIDFLKSSI